MFSPVEWMIALRYMRARRAEGFISVIAGFSLMGIALGVATLIIVLSVMNGFRMELLDRILGLNGHIAIISSTGTLSDYDPLAERVRLVDGVLSVTPLVEGQVLATNGARASGASSQTVRARSSSSPSPVGLRARSWPNEERSLP